MASQPKHRQLEIEDIGDVTVVHFTERKILDEQKILKLGEDLYSIVDELGRRKILLNFGKVEYFSSAALGTFAKLNEKVTKANGKLVLCNVRKSIYEVFELTNMHRLLDFAKDEATALQAF